MTAVGGTDNLQNQKPWVASGGGFSWTTGRPDWQKNAVQAYLDKAKSSLIWPAATAFNVTNRAYPDVASYAGEVEQRIDPSFSFAMILLCVTSGACHHK